MSRYLIYGLVDPRTRLVFYVGKSSNGLRRPSDHRRPGALRINNERTLQIRQLIELNLDYEIVVLETITDPRAPATRCWWWTGLNATALNDAERWWIAYGRASDWPLTNLTDGGDGFAPGSPNQPMRNPEIVARMHAAKILKGTSKHSPETRAKISNSNKGKLLGRPKSSETKEKMRLNSPMRNDPELRKRVADKQRGRKHSTEARANMSEGVRRRWSSATAQQQRISQSGRSKRAWTDPLIRQRILDGMKTRKRRPHGPCGTVSGYEHNLRERRKGRPNCGPCIECKRAAALVARVRKGIRRLMRRVGATRVH